LLEPLNKPPIDITRNNAVWRDAKKIAHRFDRADSCCRRRETTLSRNACLRHLSL
jgi:hypothetical protein